ncbi:MAG: hypothetical protein HKN55_00115 [Woeseiaceae bacterium]|nr:hypothetical protein [Woeseiaceae bacterium]
MTEKARKRPGRPKGARNKRTEAQIRQIEESGLTPLQYFASIYQDQSMPESMRLQAAQAAAPFVHPRLSTSEVHTVSDENRSIEDFSDEELLKTIEGAKGDVAA